MAALAAGEFRVWVTKQKMKDYIKEFEDELEIFRKETQSGTQFFYSYLAINAVIGDDKQALDAVNETPLFWATNIGALQTAFFIVLGRIFDQKSAHNIDKLLNIAQKNPEIFSKASLGKRKRQGNSFEPEWLPEYLNRAYEPTFKDFRRLRKHVRNYRKIYERNYRDIRRKIYAHKELSDRFDIKELYRKTRLGELEKIFVFLNKLYESLWELFLNGRKPVLRPMRYSVIQIKNKRRSDWQSRGVHEKIVGETQDFFRNFTLKAKQLHARERL